MQNFIVLGIIPGTNIQLNFTAWLYVCITLVTTSLVMYERHAIRSWLLSHYVAYRINRLRIAPLR